MKMNENIDWNKVSKAPGISESFIEKHKDKLDWFLVSQYQQLSEGFIEKHKNRVDWYFISQYQKLSEPFIEKYKDKVKWIFISQYQKLSEPFIEKFKDKVNWIYISKYKKLSESFIEKYKDKLDWNYISKYQHLSGEFIEKYNITIPEDCWLYKTKEEKLHYLKNNNCPYEIIDYNYILAYKSTREDGYSVYNFQYKYETNKTYEAHCDCNQDNHNSFGLSVWTKEKALEYYPYGKLFLVKINIDNIGTIIPDYKIRCHKLTVLEEVEKD